MTLPNVFAIKPAGNVPAAELDKNFDYLIGLIPVNVINFDADNTGSANSSPDFQAAVDDSAASGARVSIYVPPGTYKLDDNVVPNGRIVSWIIDPGASFTGAGIIAPTVFGYFYNTTPDLRNTNEFYLSGSAAVPVATTAALDVGVKYTSAAGNGLENNAASYRATYKYSSTSGARAQSYFGESIDMVGGVNTFVEGARFHGITHSTGTLGSAYGMIAQGSGAIGSLPTYVIGVEAVAIRQDSVNAPATASFDKNHYGAALLATIHTGGDQLDAGFIVNPYSAVPFRTGFMVAENSTNDTAFANRATLTNVFSNLGSATTAFYAGTNSYAALLMLNGANSVIRAKNGAGNADHNILTYSSGNILQLGTDATGIGLMTHVSVTDAKNISLGTTTGTKFGTAANQKLAFYNATPIVQQTGVAVSAAGVHAALVNLGLITA